MNPKLMQALLSVSSTAAVAKDLAQKLIKDNSPDIVKQLNDRIAELEHQVSELSSFAPRPEPLSEITRASLLEAFTTRFANLAKEELYVYGYAYFKQFTPEVRVVVATVLKNHAFQLQIQPADIWLDVIAANGELK